MNSSSLFKKISGLKVFIIGDVMLDNYWFGYSDRQSPEAPVPIVSLQKKESRLGGAFNVALNCKAFTTHVTTLSVIGKDDEARRLLDIAESEGLNTKFILQSTERVTTSKSRVISSNKHLLRIDDEEASDLPLQLEQKFINHCLKAIQIEKPDAIILQDYNKGVLTPSVIKNVIMHAKEIGCIVAVDPKHDNFWMYQGVDIFKPNLKEIKEALSISDLSVHLKALKNIHQSIHQRNNNTVSFVTLSDKGVFVQKENCAHMLKAHKRNIVDVSGAGDTVIAVATLVYTATLDALQMAQIANTAGGLVCEEVGVVSISKKRLLSEIRKEVNQK